VLAVNAKSTHQAAAWKFIQWLDSPAVQIQRALMAGDPPGIQSAYTDQLYSKAPYFKQEVEVFKAATPRPVSPDYPKISDTLQSMLSSVLARQQTPQEGLSQAQTQIQQDTQS
jgi:multiple sugar transport system substrate-binding protein